MGDKRTSLTEWTRLTDLKEPLPDGPVLVGLEGRLPQVDYCKGGDIWYMTRGKELDPATVFVALLPRVPKQGD